MTDNCYNIDMQIACDIADFLIYNKDGILIEVIKDLEPLMKREHLFVNDEFFHAFEITMEEEIVNSVRKFIMKRFHLNIEQAYEIIDRDFLELTTNNYFFDRRKYGNPN